MALYRSLISLAILDFLVFASAWFAKADFLIGNHPTMFRILYDVSAGIGFIVAVYAFVQLLRGGSRWLRPSAISIIFATAPGCAFLVTVLSNLGRPI